MAETYTRLGAAAASTTTPTTAGTNIVSNSASAGTATVISTIVICNTASTAATYYISTSNTSGTHDTTGFVAYAAAIAANDSVFLTVGLVLDPACKYLVVNASATTVKFQAYGLSIS